MNSYHESQVKLTLEAQARSHIMDALHSMESAMELLGEAGTLCDSDESMSVHKIWRTVMNAILDLANAKDCLTKSIMRSDHKS